MKNLLVLFEKFFCEYKIAQITVSINIIKDMEIIRNCKRFTSFWHYIHCFYECYKSVTRFDKDVTNL